MSKKELGQFFTTNYKYILKDLHVPENTTVVEPFCGDGDLLSVVPKSCKIEAYDIDPKHDYIIKRDTLMNRLDMANKFILTNPPYLARNKSSDKSIFDVYKVNDLYKCFMVQLIESNALGGILIVPLNLWSSIRESDVVLRKNFLKKYSVVQLNIFEEQVFNDTTYTVCSFQFVPKIKDILISNMTMYPSGKKIKPELDNIKYLIGSIWNGRNIYELNGSYAVSRVTRLTSNSDTKTNIVVKCIDDPKKKICLFYTDKPELYVDNTKALSCRTYMLLDIEPKLNKEEQKTLIDKFNNFLNSHRENNSSLFLSNYRESNRKRISFDLVYGIISFLLSNE